MGVKKVNVMIHEIEESEEIKNKKFGCGAMMLCSEREREGGRCSRVEWFTSDCMYNEFEIISMKSGDYENAFIHLRSMCEANTSKCSRGETSLREQ